VKGIRVGFMAVAQFLNENDRGRYVHVADYSNPAQVEELLDLVRAAAPCMTCSSSPTMATASTSRSRRL